MTEKPFDPIVLYHATRAPRGQKFTVEAEVAALGADWVDTPTKFVPTAPAPSAIAEDVPALATKPASTPKTTKLGLGAA